jgi:hypothetical protein
MLAKIDYLDELQRQAFLLSAAGLGACFAVLYRVRAQVLNATYSEDGNFELFLSLVLGLISGTILAQLVPIDEVGKLGTLTKPTLALVGGFSSSLVFRVLSRIVDSVEAIFAPDADDRAQITQQQTDAQVRDARSGVALELTKLLPTVNPADTDTKIRKIISDLTSGG